MDEATAAAVNSAVQSAIGAISGGVATAQGGVASLRLMQVRYQDCLIRQHRYRQQQIP